MRDRKKVNGSNSYTQLERSKLLNGLKKERKLKTMRGLNLRKNKDNKFDQIFTGSNNKKFQ